MIVAMKNTPDPNPSALPQHKDMHNPFQHKPLTKHPNKKGAQPSPNARPPAMTPGAFKPNHHVSRECGCQSWENGTISHSHVTS